ncbi:MAG: histidine--tRNA ligase [Bacteriovoracaceae bacterium]
MALTKTPYRGTRDFFPADMRLRNFIFHKMAEVSEQFAYEPYDGPLLEEVELYLAKSGEELINEQIYSFIDRGERNVAIRPEMTPTLARMVAQVHREIPKPIRMYAIPNLMRYEKPQKGRLREFWQYNADIFGAGMLGELEIIQLAVAIMKSFGAQSSQFSVLINDRRLVDHVFHNMIGLDAAANKKLYKLVDKKNKMPTEKFASEVRTIITDESKAQIFEKYTALKTAEDVKNFIGETPVLEIFRKLNDMGLSDYVSFDPSIVRGLDYYTGVVFEIFDKHPDNNRAVAGGGSYANLLQIFNEPALEGVGIGLGEVPLTEFLKAHGLMPDFSKASVDYLVAYLVPEAEGAAMKFANHLRHKWGVKVEVMLGETKPKKVFTYSEKKNVVTVCFFGEQEMKTNTVKVKDLAARTEETLTIEDFYKKLGTE